MANSVGDHETSQSIPGYVYQNFQTLDARIASELKKMIKRSNFKKKVHLEEQKALKEDRFMKGQADIACMIYEYFRVTGTHETIIDFSDLISVTLRGDDVQVFDTRWDEVLSAGKTENPVSRMSRLCSHTIVIFSLVSVLHLPL